MVGSVLSKKERHWDLPTSGGHDLSPARDGRSLYVTTDTNVYRFVIEDGSFLKDDELGDLPKVKSVDEHPLTGQRIYQKAGESWWSETIRFGESERVIELPGERLYKVRWDALRAGTLSDAHLNQLLDQLAESIGEEPAARDYVRWPVEEVRFTASDEPTWEGQINAIREFLTLRIEWLDQNL